MRLSVILFGLAQILGFQAKTNPAFKARLKGKNLVVQLKVLDNSIGRYYIFQDGKVSSRKGIHPKPDVCMAFPSEKAALTLMSPSLDPLAKISAAKTFQISMEGDDEAVSWWTQITDFILLGKPDYGVDVGGGMKRYTNNSNAGPVFVYVKNDKIIRITPIEFDGKDAEPWTIKARGRNFTPPRKTSLSPYGFAYKSLVYSPDRLLYPMKRVDFDPAGERNPENRGISGYERISWDEALGIVADEIRRARRDYGPGTVFSSHGSHHTWGLIGYFLSAHRRFFNTIGATKLAMNPDSWEGWFWGATHHWGHNLHLGCPEGQGTVEDLLKECEMVVFWSSDPEATGGVYGSMEGTVRRGWLKELGIQCVHIDPYYNHTAAWLGGKWLAPRPTTSPALAHAIAYVWVTEDLYDKEYIETHTTGFDEWKNYLLGKEDGIPKTPEWQESETGVPARDVRALAREWAAKKTYLAVGGMGIMFGGACRSATGIEWARSMIYLMAMRGLGKPGINFGNLQISTPVDHRFYFPGYAEGGMSGDLNDTASAFNMYQRMPHLPTMNPVGQRIPRLMIPEAILEGSCETYDANPYSVETQFMKYKYPAPGYSPVKIYYKYGGSYIGTQTETNRYVKAYRTPNLDLVVNQSIWFEGEAKFADILLPVCTNFERWDISESANIGMIASQSYSQNNHRVILMQHKCIEPLGESKSDYEIFLLLSEKLGLSAPFAEGTSELGWVKRLFAGSDLSKVVSWKEFIKKGYYVVPAPPEAQRSPVAYRWYVENRAKDLPDLSPLPADSPRGLGMGMPTQSGKIEFVSSSLKRFDPDDPERPVMSKYRPGWESPHGDPDLYRQYPLQLLSPHPRYSFHTQDDGKDSILNDIKDHRVLIDGYYYWIARLNPQDAAERGIQEHDLIKLYNDRGTVICASQVTERIPPGVVHSYEASTKYDPIGEPGYSTDRGGTVNLLTSKRMLIKKSHSNSSNSCLIQVEKWDGK